jgi:hypothetical protein
VRKDDNLSADQVNSPEITAAKEATKRFVDFLNGTKKELI